MHKSILLLALVCLVPSVAWTRLPEAQQNFCQGCRSIISFMTKFNSSTNLTEYKELFRGFCSMYYPPSTDFQRGACPYFVDGLYYVLDRIDPIHHCDEIGACQARGYQKIQKLIGQPESNNKLVSQLVTTEDGLCDICESAIKQAKEQLEDPKMIDIIRRQLEAFCDYLVVVRMDSECRAMLDKYIDQLINFVAHIDPLEYCKSVRLCSQTQIENKKFLTHNADFTSPLSLLNFHNFSLDTNIAESYNTAVKKPGPACAICKAVVKEIEHYLDSNRTEEAIENALTKVCDLIFKEGGSNQQQCEDMVKAYTKELVKILADESDPEIVCMMIEQCTYGMTPAPAQPDSLDNVPSEPQLNFLRKGLLMPAELPPVPVPTISEFMSMLDPGIQLNSMRSCVECKLFISYLQQTFESPKSRDTLKQWLLDNLCDHLDDSKTRESCAKMVETYSDDFFKAIAQQLEPQEVCFELKACNKKLVLKPLDLWLNPKPESTTEDSRIAATEEIIEDEDIHEDSSSICEQCVEVVTKLDDYLSTHPIDKDVNELIEQVCDKIPNESAKESCSSIIKTFGEDLVEKLHTMDNPTQFCQSIFLC